MTSFSNDNDRPRTSEARGIAFGLILCIPFWAAVLGGVIWFVTSGATVVHDAQIASARAAHPVTIEAQP